MDANYLQTSFLGGEWSKTAQARIDRPDYKTAMNVCFNGLPIDTGAWTRRPGTQFGNHTRNGLPGRGITWSFQENAPYTMEFTDGFIRFHNGVQLSTTNDRLTVESISSANPAVVGISIAHGWNTDDQVFFSLIESHDPRLLRRQFSIRVIDTTHFSLFDALTGDAINGAELLPLISARVSRIAEISSPYSDTYWPDVRSVQAQTKSVLLHGAVAPRILTAIPPAGTEDATFSLAESQFFDGPYLDPVVGATITPASVSGIVGCSIVSSTWSGTTPYNNGDFVIYSGNAYQSLINTNLNNTPSTSAFAWAPVSQDLVIGPNGLQGTDIGRHVRLFSEPLAWDVATTYAAGNSVKYQNGYWTSVVSSNTGNQPGLDITKWAINANAANWTWGKIVSLTGAAATLVPKSGAYFANRLLFPERAFDGVVNKAYQDGTYFVGSGGNATDFTLGSSYAAGQAVSYVVVTAPNDRGYVRWKTQGTGTITFKLRGKATPPASPTDGTLLGTSVNPPSTTPGQVTQIFSNDAATAWKYLWVETVINRQEEIAEFGITGIHFSQMQVYTATAFSGTGISIQILGPPLQYTSAITTWRLGLFSSSSAYPTCGTYHEGRLWLSGVVSNRVDASAHVDIYGQRAPSLFYFTPTLQDGTVSDACAIDYTLDGPDVNSVFWMQPDQQGIIVGTQAGEWLVQASNLNSRLTPTDMQAHRATNIGCANIEPRRTEHTLVFVQKYQRSLMEYFPDIYSGKFAAPNLAVQAQHITARVLMELAYQQQLTPVIWCRCEDGSLVGASYKRESLMQSQGPAFVGWHRHSLGSGRTIESVCAGPAPETAGMSAGLLDTLAVVTNDPATGVRHMEFLRQIFAEGDDQSDAWFLDNAVRPVVTQSVTANGRATCELSGLWHLNGKTVTAFLGGLDCGEFFVANGKINVEYGLARQPLFTLALAESFSGTMPALVGFTYDSDGQLLRPANQQESGARTGPAIGKKRRTQDVIALLVNANAISFGTVFNKMNAAKLTTEGGTKIAENALFTDTYRESLTNDYNYDSMICWRSSRPYPATVAALGGMLQTQDA